VSRPLRDGESVLFVDSKGRRNLVKLATDGEYHTHTGPIPLNNVIGADEGIRAATTGGAKYLVFRPTLGDYILKMRRGAQVIYPKDLGPILILADIFPGARVLEAGVGSGALSMTMLRAGASITGYEIREDFAADARNNVAAFLGDEVLDRFKVEVRDVYDGIDEEGLDRVVLDLPEPWRVVPHAEKALRQGGILVSYLPSIIQVGQLREALAESAFELCATVEVLQRGWYVEGRAVRPDHRMVGHTGFLTHARLLGG
jgi:tRNA (adenine57-N1/adenine58-N1)-methyltransferase